MGKLIKNHWARLILISAAGVQIGAGIEGFFWPKIFWDIFTDNLNVLVDPFPYLQIINIVFGIFTIAMEWPLKFMTQTPFHRSIAFRLMWIPVTATAATLIYQGPDSTGYHLLALGAYFWAFAEGETICPVPWTLPKKAQVGKA